MKVLFLVDNPDAVEKYFMDNLPELKTISERDLSIDTPFVQRFLKPGYTTYLTTRAGHYIRAYRASRPLAVILDKRHQEAIEKIPVDKTVKVVDTTPRRLSHGTSYKTDVSVTVSEFTKEFIAELYSLDKSTES